jgi:alkanesulfonate monooxygenase
VDGRRKITGAGGNSTSLVGTADQVADALLDYYDLGITTFLIRGFDPLGDAIEYGRELIPLVRERAKNARPRRAERGSLRARGLVFNGDRTCDPR